MEITTPTDTDRCSLSVSGTFSRCPNAATRWHPVERTVDGVTTRQLVQPVCDSCDRMHYRDHSVRIGEPFDWDTDPRVLRYNADEVLGRFRAQLEAMDCAPFDAHTCAGDTLDADCAACFAAALHPCAWCGYGTSYSTHDADSHRDNGDPNVPAEPSRAWVTSPHLEVGE
jgi:hypothetical protein